MREIFCVLLGFIGHFAFFDLIRRYVALPDVYSYVSGGLILRVAVVILSKGYRRKCTTGIFDAALITVGTGVICGRVMRKLLHEIVIGSGL